MIKKPSVGTGRYLQITMFYYVVNKLKTKNNNKKATFWMLFETLSIYLLVKDKIER